MTEAVITAALLHHKQNRALLFFVCQAVTQFVEVTPKPAVLRNKHAADTLSAWSLHTHTQNRGCQAASQAADAEHQ